MSLFMVCLSITKDERRDKVIKLYTIDCPRCKILEQKLVAANIEFETCRDRAIMMARGFDLLPLLEVDGELMGFDEALKWTNGRRTK